MDPKTLENIVKLYGTQELKQTSVKRKNSKTCRLNEDDFRLACNIAMPCERPNCDKITISRRREYRLINFENREQSFWQEKCLDCGKRTTIFPRNKTK